MPVQSDLQKAIAAAESAKGNYAMFAQSTDDQSAKQMYTQMSQDMDGHISQLQNRLSVTATAATAVESAQSNTATSSQTGTQSNTQYSSSDMYNQE
jgi:bacterioferritin (cytochrome b1)